MDFFETMTFDIPDGVTDEAAATLRDAHDRLGRITIEDREYAFDPDDLPDGMDVHEDDDLYYVVHGEKPMFDGYAVAVDRGGARLAAEWSSTKRHWGDRDYAGDAYDALEEIGIPRPTVDNLGRPLGYEVGVQFGSDGGVAVEAYLPSATGGGDSE